MKKSKQLKQELKTIKKIVNKQQVYLESVNISFFGILEIQQKLIPMINKLDNKIDLVFNSLKLTNQFNLDNANLDAQIKSIEDINSTDAQPAVIYEQPKRTTKRLNSDEIKKRCEHLFIKGYIVLGEIDNQEIYSNTGRLCIHTSKKIHFNNSDMVAQSINFSDYIAYWNGLGKTLQRNAIADNQKTATYKPAKLISPLTVKKVAVKG